MANEHYNYIVAAHMIGEFGKKIKVNFEDYDECVDIVCEITKNWSRKKDVLKFKKKRHRKTTSKVDFAIAMQHYNHIIVAHIMGELQRDGNCTISIINYDDCVQKVCTVVDNWADMVDIQSHEEEGYISAYARRILTKKRMAACA